jgi:hypothetical protein
MIVCKIICVYGRGRKSLENKRRARRYCPEANHLTGGHFPFEESDRVEESVFENAGVIGESSQKEEEHDPKRSRRSHFQGL